MVPWSQIRILNPPNHWPSFPNLDLTFENSYPDLHASRAQHHRSYSFSMEQDEDFYSKGVQKMVYGHSLTNPVNPPSTPAPDYNITNHIEQRHDSLTKPDIVSASPDASVPPGWKGSRIPSNDVPRKAPLAARSSDDISPTTARKILRERPERTVSGPIATSEHIARTRLRQQQSFETPYGVPRYGRPPTNEYRGQDITAIDGLNAGYAQPPIGLFAPPQVPATATSAKSARLRPRYVYQVPSELIGTKNALGPDNWDEYVYLMEQLSFGDITAHEFDSRAKPIFQMFDEKTRKKMNNIMAMKMILPHLTEIGARGKTTKSVEDV
ncbi:hypothetical protein G6011_04339 [Alternaria panax]|uniref:Uncharacterized protein n=1 Tax=Alternaria panax TaxID=48097 RepID=A0AAD4NU38_9PLEO|nr:hypothetical protein G6011_04339 [Alternaria panax]